jgi:hypothetical protein
MKHDKELESPIEQERINSLISIIPKGYSTLLDIGARDGYISNLVSPFFRKVTALDLEKPRLGKENIIAVKGDVTCLEFEDNSFDVVLCTEVLEHISPKLLNKACSEIIRVAKNFVVIGVPYKQDVRCSRTTCSYCKGKNPPWGHVNSFDQSRLKDLFRPLCLESVYFIGKGGWGRTNLFSALLMDLAGNPWGVYDRGQCCLHCGRKVIPLLSENRNVLEKVCSKIAYLLNSFQAFFIASCPTWVHIVFKKPQ